MTIINRPRNIIRKSYIVYCPNCKSSKYIVEIKKPFKSKSLNEKSRFFGSIMGSVIKEVVEGIKSIVVGINIHDAMRATGSFIEGATLGDKKMYKCQKCDIEF